MKDIFGNNIFSLINFDLFFEGLVLDNSDFKEHGFIKVFIPELFVYESPKITDNKSYAEDTVESFKTSIIDNIDDLLVSNDLKSANYIKVYPELSNYVENLINNKIETIENECLKINDSIKNKILEIEKTTDKNKIALLEKEIKDLQTKVLEYKTQLEHIIDDHYNFYMPKIGQKVIIYFINGNPLLPYYDNMCLFNKEKFKFPIDILMQDYKPTIKDDIVIKDEETEEEIKYYYADTGYSRVIHYKGNISENEKYDSYEEDNTVKLMFGDDILALNENLYKLGYTKVKGNQTINPYYTKGSALAVKHFQNWYNEKYNENLKLDCIVGPIIFEKIEMETLKGSKCY